MPINPIPAGFHTITPFIMVDDVDAVIEFARKAFGAEQTFRMEHTDGKVMHAQIRIGDSNIMLGTSMGHEAQPAILYLYTDRVDSMYASAVEAGGLTIQEPKNMFYGDRSGAVKDSQGNSWWIATHVEDVDEAELNQRVRQWEEQVREAEAKHEVVNKPLSP